jgi:DNA-directed RNA polymerase specialized sigma24 family protein
LQFHQPDESITGATVIRDDRVATPEQIMATEETLHLIASVLRDIRPRAREAFILYAIEGFAVDEISAITGLPTEGVVASISVARDHLRKAPGLARSFAGKFASSGVA